MSRLWIGIVAFQAFHVLFLLLHDWLPLPPLNNIQAARAADTTRKLLTTTILSGVPYALGLALSLVPSGPTPALLYLRIVYTILFVGELTAWWIPYFGAPQPKRAARYALLFRNTHSLLPPRNGISPNTLHLVLHTATLVRLVLLFAV